MKKIRQNKSLGEEKRVKSYLFQQRRLFNWQSERKMTKKNVKQIICGDFCDNFQIIVNHEHTFQMK